MNLELFMSTEEANSIRAQLAKSPFRRLAHTTENTIDTRVLCQALHVDRLTGEPRLLISDPGGKDGYYALSVKGAEALRDQMQQHGIRRLFVGPLAAAGSTDNVDERVERFAEMVGGLRQSFGEGFEIIVDPAGICMHKDLRWGVRNAREEIDVEATLVTLGRAARAFGDAGADGVVAIGRVNCEVEVLRAAAERSSRAMRVMSFSTNSETTSAYFETTRHDLSRSRTGQKILVGNGNEMVVRGVSDFGEGSDVILQKPVEAFHLLALFNQIASGRLPISSFVAKNPSVQGLLRDNPLLAPAFELGASLIQQGPRMFKTGTYEVSGTYSTVRMLARAYGEELAWSMMDEILLNAASAAGQTLDIMISRNALWYAQTRQQIARKTKQVNAELAT